MNTRPTFSIIVPVYNAEKTLADAVRSVTGQSFADFELLLVDDCSPDGSAALAQAFCGLGMGVYLVCFVKDHLGIPYPCLGGLFGLGEVADAGVAGLDGLVPSSLLRLGVLVEAVVLVLVGRCLLLGGLGHLLCRGELALKGPEVLLRLVHRRLRLLGYLGDFRMLGLKIRPLGGKLSLDLRERGTVGVAVRDERVVFCLYGAQSLLCVVDRTVRRRYALRPTLGGVVDSRLGALDGTASVGKCLGGVVGTTTRAVHEVSVRPQLLLVALRHAAQVVLEALLLCPLLLDLLRGVVYLRLCRVNLSRLRQYDFFVVALHILAMHKKRAVLFEPLLYVAQIGLGVCPELGCLPNLAHGAKAACDGPAGASRGACCVVARA